MNSTYVPNFRIFRRDLGGGGGIRPPPRTWNRQKSPALLGLKEKLPQALMQIQWMEMILEI